MKVTAENNEIVMQNSNGDTIIIPKVHRQKALKYIEEGNYKAIDDLAESLPFMEDYADEGSLIVPGLEKIDPKLVTKPPTDPPISQIHTTTNTVSDKFNLPIYLNQLDPSKKYDKNKLLRTLLAQENYATSGKFDYSPEEEKDFVTSRQSMYDSNEELVNAVNTKIKTAPIRYEAYSAANKKFSEYSDSDITLPVQEAVKHYKTQYGKTTPKIYSIKSENVGFKGTPLHRDIYNKIVSGAKKVGIDKYTALGLAMVESNFGKGYVGKNEGSSMNESRMYSNWDGKSWSKGKYFDLNEGPTGAFENYLKAKNINVEEADEEVLKTAQQEFNAELDSIHPFASTGIESALTYYKKNPKGYNSGNKTYTTTVEAAANTMRNDPNFSKWEKQQ
jgi:hypothetical protein